MVDIGVVVVEEIILVVRVWKNSKGILGDIGGVLRLVFILCRVNKGKFYGFKCFLKDKVY